MGSELGNVTNNTIREALGSRAMTAAGIAIHGTNTENVLTGAAVVHTINGVFQTDFAIDTEVDISALAVLNGKDGTVIGSGLKTYAARVAGDADQTLTLILVCKGDTAWAIESSVDVAAAQDDADYNLAVPDGFCAWGLVILVRTAADTAAFQFGNNTAATGDLDATGRTATFFDLCGIAPQNVAAAVTV